MNSLFVRLWIALWLTIVVVVLLSIEVFDYARSQSARPLGPPDKILGQLAEEAIKAVEAGDSLENWLEDASSRRQPVFLLNAQGDDLLRRPVPNYLQRARSLYNFRRDARPGRPPRLRLLRPLPELGDLTLAVARPNPRAQFRWLTLEVFIVLGFIVSGIVAVGLARYITNPIRRLKTASDQIALGDFQTNVAVGLGGRRDELGELAERFDEMAAKLARSRAQQQGLLRDISHELRSPLARLLITSDLIPAAQGEELQDLRQRFRKDIDHLDAMIEEVLTLSRFDAHGPEQASESLNVVEVLEPVIDDAQFEADALGKSVRLVAPARDEAPWVVGNCAELRRAVENVVRNGVRHAPTGTSVDVRVSKTSANQADFVVVAITDQGAGVAEGDLEHIFTPFFRSPSERARSSGYGIGLSLVKRIIEAHGGQVSAANRDAEGFEVRLLLPWHSSAGA